MVEERPGQEGGRVLKPNRGAATREFLNREKNHREESTKNGRFLSLEEHWNQGERDLFLSGTHARKIRVTGEDAYPLPSKAVREPSILLPETPLYRKKAVTENRKKRLLSALEGALPATSPLGCSGARLEKEGPRKTAL